MNGLVALNLVCFSVNIAGYIATGVWTFLAWSVVSALACFICLDKEPRDE